MIDKSELASGKEFSGAQRELASGKEFSGAQRELASGKEFSGAQRELASGKEFSGAQRELASGKEFSGAQRVNEHNPLHIEAKTIELALVRAGAALGVPQDQVDYRVLKKDRGIAALFSRKVELEIWNRTAAEASSTADLTPAVEQEVIAELVSYCRDICSLVSGTEVVVSARRDGQRLILDIDDGWLLSSVSRYPNIIEALEHLLRKKPRHLRRGLPFRIFVDVKQHRIDREAEVVQRARDLAARVVADQRPLTMNCRGPHERRVIHLALDDDQRIYTKSIGKGFERKLMILPASTRS